MKELIPFLMAGDPDLATTERLALALADAGVRTLELGVPFSDPLADGPVIQRAAARSLTRGTNVAAVLRLCARLKERKPELTIVLFTYLNPLFQLGLPHYAKSAKANGVDATLVVDLPLEESGELRETHRAEGLGTVFLTAPTTDSARLRQLGKYSSPFLYVISRNGITGGTEELPLAVRAQLSAAREATRVPLALGFGISSAEQARTASLLADHVVIGSKLLSLLEASPNVAEAEATLTAFARDCLRSMNEDSKGGQCP